MMAQLTNVTNNAVLLADLSVASHMGTRSKGLIGTKSLSPQQGLWIPRCNWIHTFFMSIPIDVIYLNKKLIVTKLQHQVVPWRFPFPVFSAQSVVELAGGRLKELNIKVGDQLDVGH